MTRALVVLFILGLPAAAGAQLLGRASDAVRGSSDDDDDDYDYDSGSDEGDDYSGQYDDDDGGGLLGSASDAVRGSSSSGSSGRSSSGGGSWGRSRSRPSVSGGYVLGDRPYAGGAGGYAQPIHGAGGEVRDGRLAARLEMELGYALGGAGRGGLGVRVSVPAIVDIVSRYSVFLEPTEDGLTAAALGRLGIDLRVIDVPAFQLRVGGAIRHWHDPIGGVVGADVALGFDVYPGDPVILSAEFAAGAVGDAIVVLARGSIGFIIESTEIYAGYHYEGLIAGGQHVDLGGPMLGARIWL